MSNNVFRAALLGAGCVLLSACGTSDKPAQSSTTTASQPQTTTLQLRDGWVKADEKGKMTAAFGTLSNPGGSPVTITGVSSDLGKTEMHETVMSGGAMVMKPVQSFKVPARGTFALKPGGNHLMFLDLPRSLRVGEAVRVSLSTSAGKVELRLPVRAFDGAKETYQPSASSAGHH